MRYPKWLRKINDFLGRVGGVMCFVVATMFLLEAILRYVFRSPTSWMENYACYLHCLALFMGCAFTFQVHGHVGVDLVKKMVDKRSDPSKNRRGTRVMSIVGYFQTMFFLVIAAYSTIKMCINAHNLGSMTASTYPIPQYWLYLIMSIGFIWMMITVVFIIIDLFMGNNEFNE